MSSKIEKKISAIQLTGLPFKKLLDSKFLEIVKENKMEPIMLISIIEDKEEPTIVSIGHKSKTEMLKNVLWIECENTEFLEKISTALSKSEASK